MKRLIALAYVILAGHLMAQTAAQPMNMPEVSAWVDGNGKPFAGGYLCTFQAGTTTPLASYTDASAITPNSNPVVLDSNGRASVWLSPTQLYKFVLYVGGNGSCPGSGTVVWSQDQLTGSSSGTVQSVGIALPASTFACTGAPVTINGTLTCTFVVQAQNAVLAGPVGATPAVPTWRTDIVAQVMGVPAYGCDPSGATLSDTCFTTILAQLPSGGGRVYLPAGTYQISSTILETLSNVEIYGAGMGATTIQAKAGAQIPLTVSHDSEMLDLAGSNVYIHDLTFDCNNQGTNLSMALGIPRWDAGTTYWASGLAKDVGGGGQDTALYATGNPSAVCSVANPCTAYVVKPGNNPIPVSTVPTNTTYWQSEQTGITTYGNGIGIAVRGNNTRFVRVEIKNGDLGIRLFGVTDVEIASTKIHDMGNTSQLLGNNVTLNAVNGIGDHVKVHDNEWFNIYASPLGPGATAGICVYTTSLVFANNNITNVINNGGGSATGGCSGVGANWTITGNNIRRTIGGINNDVTNGIEVEATGATVTGNSIVGFDSGIGIDGLPPTAAIASVISNNTIYGDNCAIMDSSLITTFCYGIYVFGVASSDYAQNSSVSGNSISNTYYGVIDTLGNTGTMIGANNFNGVSVNIQEPNQNSITIPPLESSSIAVDSTLNVFTAGTYYYSTKRQPILVNGSVGAGLIAGTVFKVHALVFVQNNTGGTNTLIPQLYLGHSGSVTNFAPTTTLTVPVSTTLGWLVIDAECNVNNVAAMGSVVCSGTGLFATGTSTTYLPLLWSSGASIATNAWTASDYFGLNFTTGTNNSFLTAQVYSIRYEVIFPKSTT